MKIQATIPAVMFAAFLAAGWAEAADCLQWVKRTDVGSYGQRYQHAMAYDPDRGVTVFFGGEIGEQGDETFFNDTQEYDGKQWKQINTAVKPPPRAFHTMTYDPVRKKIVLFGGLIRNGSDPYLVYTDTWVYSGDGVNGFWEQKQPPAHPPATIPTMVWDPVNRVALLHAGLFGSTWTWDGANWVNIVSGPWLFGFGMAFDVGRSKAVIAGGTLQVGGTVNTIWEKGPTTGWENRGPGPSIRSELALAYDERRGRIVMVGGSGESVETGETAYEYIPDRGWIILPSLSSGQGRAGAKMVYDSKRGVMVLTGGAGGGAPNADNGGRYSDTWELWPSLFISGQPFDVTNEVCTTATFSAGVQGNPPLQFTWLRDGAALPPDERYLGAETPELKIFSVRHGDAGKYALVVRDTCDPPNVVTSRVATLTTTPESEWVFRTANGPAARFGHAMVYDRARHVTVLFGGGTNHNFVAPFNDLWEWDGARWTQRVENSVSNGWTLVSGRWAPSYQGDQPVRRADCAMAYDARRGIVMMFGGWGKTPDGGDFYLRDLWEWDGDRWHFRATNGPIARYGGSMAYDEARGRSVLLGGHPVITAVGDKFDDDLVWEWDTVRWHGRSSRVVPGPGSRQYGRTVYDSFRGSIVFGPVPDDHGYAAFWDWDGDVWINNAPSAYLGDPVLVAMNGTIQSGLAFDAERRRTVWFGGYQSGPQNRTVLFDGSRWTFMTNSPPPPRRGELAMAYDSDRHVMVMFGGSLASSGTLVATNDTWELAAADAPAIIEQPASQVRAAGETATFHTSALGHGFVAYQWYFQNQLLAGAQSDTLTIPSIGEQNVGQYYVRVGSQCGSATSHVATLTLNSNLQIISSSGALSLLWAPRVTGSNSVFLETAESVTGPWTIVPNPMVPFPISGTGPAKFYRYRKPD